MPDVPLVTGTSRLFCALPSWATRMTCSCFGQEPTTVLDHLPDRRADGDDHRSPDDALQTGHRHRPLDQRAGRDRTGRPARLRCPRSARRSPRSRGRPPAGTPSSGWRRSSSSRRPAVLHLQPHEPSTDFASTSLRSAAIASGLFSSTPTYARAAPVTCMIRSRPTLHVRGALGHHAVVNRSGTARTRSVEHHELDALALGTLSLTWVGNAAPPRPTKPSALDGVDQRAGVGLASDPAPLAGRSLAGVASVVMTMVSTRLPLGARRSSTAFTVPVTGACRWVETKPELPRSPDRARLLPRPYHASMARRCAATGAAGTRSRTARARGRRAAVASFCSLGCTP